MSRFLFLSLTVLFGVFWLIIPQPAISDDGNQLQTFIIHNNTGATISVVVRGNISSERLIPPYQKKSYENDLFPGTQYFQIQAPCVSGTRGFVKNVVVFMGNNPTNLYIFPADFGKSVMFDGPNCDIGQPKKEKPRTVELISGLYRSSYGDSMLVKVNDSGDYEFEAWQGSQAKPNPMYWYNKGSGKTDKTGLIQAKHTDVEGYPNGNTTDSVFTIINSKTLEQTEYRVYRQGEKPPSDNKGWNKGPTWTLVE